MSFSEHGFFILIGLAVLAGALLGAMLVHNGWRRAYGAVLAGHVFGALGLLLAIQQSSQWGAVGYSVMLVVFVIPATLGMGLGGAAIWLRQRRAARR